MFTNDLEVSSDARKVFLPRGLQAGALHARHLDSHRAAQPLRVVGSNRGRVALRAASSPEGAQAILSLSAPPPKTIWAAKAAVRETYGRPVNMLRRRAVIVMDAYDRADGLDAGPHSDWPMASLTPTEVVEKQLAALKLDDIETCFRFASPKNKRATGPWQRFERMIRQTPAYAPLVGCQKFSIVGAFALGPERYRCRVRVWPARNVSVLRSGVMLEAPVLDYDWMLTRQSDKSSDHTIAGCWMVDDVLPDATPREVWDEEFGRQQFADWARGEQD